MLPLLCNKVGSLMKWQIVELKIYPGESDQNYKRSMCVHVYKFSNHNREKFI